MGKLAEALRVLLENSNLNDPGKRDTIQAAIDADEEKHPSKEGEDKPTEEQREPTGDKESGRSTTQTKVTSGEQQKKDGK